MRFTPIITFALVALIGIPGSAGAVTSDALGRAIARYFPEAPEMVEIARCESGLRQYGADGHVLRGGAGGKMLGLFQFHETYHAAHARALGYDLTTLLGNIAYARVLWRAQGTAPWESSRSCWDTQPRGITKTLRYGVTDPEVSVLRHRLNMAGHTVPEEGERMDYFDISVYKALTAFQCERGIACRTGSAPRAGVGATGIATRKALGDISTVTR